MVMRMTGRKEEQRLRTADRLLSGQTILFDVLLFALLGYADFLLPFATYTYKKIKYSVTGIMFVTGAVIQGGTVTIKPQLPLVFCLLLLAFIAFTAVIFPKVKKVRIPGIFMIVFSALLLSVSVIFASGIDSAMNEARNPGTAPGVWLLAAIAVVLIARMLQIFYINKVLSVLDFLLMPAAIYLLINNYFPMIGIFIAFKNIDYAKGIFASDWVGLKNFRYLFTTSDAFIMTRNTLLYNLVFIIIGNVMGIITAIFLNDLFSKKLQKLFQTSILLPQLISIIIVAYIVYAFLGNEAGLVNKAILKDANAVNFYNTPKYWPFILVLVNTWKGLGYSSVIYLSAIVGISKDLYEAAYVDGAGKLRQVFSITLPLLKPTIITLLIMSLGRIFFSDFGLFYQVPKNSGALFSVTQTIDTYVYRSLMQMNNISMSSAAGVYQSVIGFLVVLLANGLIRKFDKENAMF